MLKIRCGTNKCDWYYNKFGRAISLNQDIYNFKYIVIYIETSREGNLDIIKIIFEKRGISREYFYLSIQDDMFYI